VVLTARRLTPRAVSFGEVAMRNVELQWVLTVTSLAAATAVILIHAVAAH
jgi:hypothetical protein